jgi:D-alanyl-lipoteichoic acid acyltransferase DltB (MBOAT superfamily)
MFKKVVVADTCAIYANDIFANYTDYSGPTLMLGAVYFAFQIYGDFSGYSDIAIGTAKLFGIQLMTNFKTPYFSRDIAEFWRRWHISLSTWFRDYLYIPLGGSRVGKWKSVRNVFVIFLVSGFWHGANWTFIIWGGIHAALFLPLLLRGKNRRYTSDTIGEGRWLPTGREFLGMAWTFTMVCVAWVFFRAESVGEALEYLGRMSKMVEGAELEIRGKMGTSVILLCLLAEAMIEKLISGKTAQDKTLQWSTYLLVMLAIMLCWAEESTQFIYFQF